MGIRLEGPRLAVSDARERLSAGVVSGTIQLPPDGHPIVLLADPLTFSMRARIVEFARERKLPAIYENREFVDLKMPRVDAAVGITYMRMARDLSDLVAQLREEPGEPTGQS